MKQIICAALLSMLLSGCDVSFNKAPPKALVSEPATEQQQRQVFEVSVEFLRSLDSGDVDKTWPASSALLKATTSETMWTDAWCACRPLRDC